MHCLAQELNGEWTTMQFPARAYDCYSAVSRIELRSRIYSIDKRILMIALFTAQQEIVCRFFN